MKYYLIAGEASGDLHASNLMRALKREDPDAEFRFFGGDLMAACGGTLVKHYRDMAYMGFIPVLMNLDKVLANMRLCKQDIAAHRPDVVILVDYPGFNLKIAKYVKTHLNIPVYYYISPKIWAWKEWRVKSIRRYVDRLYSILPFEVDFYARHHYAVEYVGNPTVDELASRPYADETFDSFVTECGLERKPIIALLAGSRVSEIKNNLPLMIEAAESYPEYQLVVAGAPGISPDLYTPYLQGHRVKVVQGKTYRLLQQSRVALVTSGTATLETALLRVPQVVCYWVGGGKLFYKTFEKILRVPYVSLVNLIAGGPVVCELLGYRATAENLRRELACLFDEENRERMLAGYNLVARRLGAPGAPEQAARSMVSALRG
ncbi:lipid-A-disaccharide synthase [Barnesiella sp. An55]|uniref:lipid-A-disaccharide synthase n=1 Tax=Barnesiella sp. An55 TaxID=1965646 RepID=UPI000B38FF03|nr:lipid-A-disaccharide synthase [Barnesiella sp. An55]OUN74403.1 lipid-A-disaccharide synthase [Barnesiella sp. An55]HIZ27196.1 lipid-A-disaccharide synthase [Candidatus Barnesiella merdipullorum]